jgi:hypothetical protein
MPAEALTPEAEGPTTTEVEALVSDRERALWTAISRGLKLIASAIDNYLREPAEQSR